MKAMYKAAAVCLTLSVCAGVFAGCGGSETKTVYELPYYSGTNTDEITGLAEYNQNLWRRNTDLLEGADPFILDNTAEDGYYYLYTTGGSGFSGYRTKNFSTWESTGVILEGEKDWSSYWAPEVVAEENAEGEMVYYLYFSALTPEFAASDRKIMFVATASSPAGPFEMVDFTDEASCDGNTHGNIVTGSYANYALFDYEKMFEALEEETGEEFSVTEIPSLIDAHPFVAENGDRYLYFSLESPRCIVGMKMTNWYTVDYSTVTLLTRVGYYTVEDYEKAQNGEQVETCEYEKMGTADVNEGPFVIEHNGKYYLTFSINAFYDASYSVMQAVGDSPLGPFTKLRDDQNGLFLSADMGGNAVLSGTGHHSFFTIGDDMYICYHRLIVNGTIDGGRGICVDEVKWVETEKDGEKLDVLYVNGPTITVQPRFDPEAEYVNIAGEGSVSLVSGTLADGSSEACLIDGLLSYNTTISQEFLDAHVRETTITEDATFEVAFPEAREVRGFLVYGSKYTDGYFASVKNVEIVVEENGAEKTYYIEELVPDDTCIVWNEDELLYGNYVVDNVVYGSGVYAEFASRNVRSIRFTVTVPEGQEHVGISEIAVLGKRA